MTENETQKNDYVDGKEIKPEKNKTDKIDTPNKNDASSGMHPDVDMQPMKEHVDLSSSPELSSWSAWRLSYDDIISFIREEHVLSDIVSDLQKNDDYIFNPPTIQELSEKIRMAIQRKNGKMSSLAAPSAESSVSAREYPSPELSKEYADPTNKAFPIDDAQQATTAHAYIHKYWNTPSRAGIPATYGRDDFIQVHKTIIVAMKNFGIEHNYLDGLDEASGTKKIETLKQVQEQTPSKFYKGQKVVSFSRGRLKEIGTIKTIDGLMASVEWGCGLETAELLARLIPIS